jgi:steroid delta-isomerase-like uncharacterized protein
MPSSTQEANKQLVHRWFEEVWNQQSESAIDEMFSPEGKSHGFPTPDCILLGPEDFKAVHRTFCSAFPKQKIVIADLIAEGDSVAVRWQATVTHAGDHLGFPASGKTVTLAGSTFLTVHGNQITEGWNFMDLGNLYQQLQTP